MIYYFYWELIQDMLIFIFLQCWKQIDGIEILFVHMASNNQLLPMSMLLDKVVKCHERLAKNLFLVHQICEENICDIKRIEQQQADEAMMMELNFVCKFDPEFLRKYKAEFDIRFSEIDCNLRLKINELMNLAEQFETTIANKLAMELQNTHIEMENRQELSTATDYQFMSDDLRIMANHLRNMHNLLYKGFFQFIDFIEDKALNIIPNANANAIDVSSDYIRMLEPEMHFTPAKDTFRYTLNWPVQKALERLRSSTI